jgi:hypothetical protein
MAPMYAHLNPNDPAFSHWFSQVSYVKEVQNWNEPFQLFKAMFEIYNLISIMQSDRPEDEGIEERIRTLASDIKSNFPHTLTSKRTQGDTDEDGGSPAKSPKRGRVGQGGNTGLGLRCGEHVYQDRQVVESFTQAGYTLESNDENENGWERLDQVRQRSTLSVDLN